MAVNNQGSKEYQIDCVRKGHGSVQPPALIDQQTDMRREVPRPTRAFGSELEQTSVRQMDNHAQRWEFTKEKNKKTRKQELDQESDQEKKKSRKDQESDQERKKKLYFFLDHFLGRVLVFLFSFINSHLCSGREKTF